MQTDVNIVTTTFCNLKCKFCVNSKVKVKPELMTYNDFKIIIDKLSKNNYKSIDLTPPIGENYTDTNYRKKLQLLNSYNFSFIRETTNFVHLTTEDFYSILEMRNPILINVSVYGDTKKSFKEFTRVDNFDKFIKNVRFLSNLYNKKMIPPHICFNLIIRYSKIYYTSHGSLNVNTIIKNYKQTNFLNNEFWRLAILMKGANINFWLFNRFENNNFCRPDLIDESHTLVYGKEKYPKKGACVSIVPTILPNGDIVICNNPEPRDLKNKIVANIFNDSMKIIKERFIKIKNRMDGGLFPEICSICSEYSQKPATEKYNGEWKI
jgi:uncharacterized Fe-S cluster-containing radical SAM superfamily protein